MEKREKRKNCRKKEKKKEIKKERKKERKLEERGSKINIENETKINQKVERKLQYNSERKLMKIKIDTRKFKTKKKENMLQPKNNISTRQKIIHEPKGKII